MNSYFGTERIVLKELPTPGRAVQDKILAYTQRAKAICPEDLRMKRAAHVGLIIRSHDPRRIDQLLNDYAARLQRDFSAVLPPATRPAN